MTYVDQWYGRYIFKLCDELTLCAHEEITYSSITFAADEMSRLFNDRTENNAGVACNYVLFAIVSGGHHCICNNVRIRNRVRPDAAA